MRGAGDGVGHFSGDVSAAPAPGGRSRSSCARVSWMAAGALGFRPEHRRRGPAPRPAQVGQSMRRRRGGLGRVARQRRQDRRLRRPRRPVGPQPRPSLWPTFRKHPFFFFIYINCLVVFFSLSLVGDIRWEIESWNARQGFIRMCWHCFVQSVRSARIQSNLASSARDGLLGICGDSERGSCLISRIALVTCLKIRPVSQRHFCLRLGPLRVASCGILPGSRHLRDSRRWRSFEGSLRDSSEIHSGLILCFRKSKSNKKKKPNQMKEEKKRSSTLESRQKTGLIHRH